MKILVIGDMHLRVELPYSSAFLDGRREEWKEVKETILKTAEKCDAVVFLGDVLNLKHNHSSVIREMVEFLKAFGEKEIHIISGNHERYGKSTALDFLQRMNYKNWTIYTEPTLTKVMDIPAMMIPFMTPASLCVETKEEGADEVIRILPKTTTPLSFIHHAIEGSSVRNKEIDYTKDFFNEIILPKDVIKEKFVHTFAGHIHEKQTLSPGIVVTGSVFTHEIGEHKKSIWVYDNGEITEIALPVREIHKITWEEYNKENVIPSNSIVKCYITSRETDIEVVKKFLKQFDASLVVEQYPSEREKVHFDDGALDLSVEGLLKLYADTKKLSYTDIKEGFELIKS